MKRRRRRSVRLKSERSDPKKSGPRVECLGTDSGRVFGAATYTRAEVKRWIFTLRDGSLLGVSDDGNPPVIFHSFPLDACHPLHRVAVLREQAKNVEAWAAGDMLEGSPTEAHRYEKKEG